MPDKYISFPTEQKEQLLSRIADYNPIYTTRVSDQYNKYKKGDVLKSNILKDLLYVSEVSKINDLDKHPFQQHLTPQQKEMLSKYKQMDVVKLVPYKWGNNPMYFQSAGAGKGKRIRIARLIKKIKQNKLKPQQVKISQIKSIRNKIDNIWGNGKYKKAKPLTLEEMATNHFPRIIKADLSYPILISQDKSGVYDGMHRLIKALYKNKKKINAFIVPDDIVKEIVQTDE